MTNDLPTAAEMRAEYDEDQSVFSFGCYARLYWPALIAMREELDRLRAQVHQCPKCGEYCRECKCWRIEQHELLDIITDLERQLAAKSAECERLQTLINRVDGEYEAIGELTSDLLTDIERASK